MATLLFRQVPKPISCSTKKTCPARTLQQGEAVMSKLRRLTLRQYGQLYHRLDNTDQEHCWYCGDGRECLDHVPSLGMLPNIDVKKFRESGGRFLLVPCCSSCNSLLGNRRLYTPNERISWLLGAYHKLFDKAYYGWSDTEVSEMGYTFRVMISAGISKSNSYISKIRAIERRILDIENFTNNSFEGIRTGYEEPTRAKEPVPKGSSLRREAAKFVIIKNDGTYLQKKRPKTKSVSFGPLKTAHQYLEKAAAIKRLNTLNCLDHCRVINLKKQPSESQS